MFFFAFQIFTRIIFIYLIACLFTYLFLCIDHIEKVQRRFTKRFVGIKTLTYAQRIHILNLSTLDLRRLHDDLVYCYEIIFGLIDVSCDDYFTFCSSSVTWRHSYKLYKPICTKSVRSFFFTSCVYKCLEQPTNWHFRSLNSFMHAVESTYLSLFLKYEK